MLSSIGSESVSLPFIGRSETRDQNPQNRLRIELMGTMRPARNGMLWASLAAGLILAAGCQPTDSSSTRSQSNELPIEPIFTEVGSESGLDFIHRNGMTGQYHMVENMGSGAALLD